MNARARADAPGLLRLWHLTSLDAPTVAAVWTLAFAWAAGVRLPLWVPVLLALAAWAAYIGDRLLDARAALIRGDVDGLRERHRFHHRHRRVLAPAAVLAACAVACIVFTLMPAPARERNGLLVCAGLVYFAAVHAQSTDAPGTEARRAVRSASWLSKRLLRKEFLVGVLFTAACALPALSRVWIGSLRWPLLMAVLMYALLAWLNCHAIDRWEDSAGRHRSDIADAAGLLALGAGCAAGLMAGSQLRTAALLAAAALSSLLLALLDRLRERLTPLALRVLADLVLLTPVALLIWQRR